MRAPHPPEPQVVLATCRARPKGDPEHTPLIDAFARLGIEAGVVPWDADFDWSAARAVLVRSTWDYHHRRDEFVSWAKRVPRLVNPARIVEWNTHKSYLRELSARGVSTVPTRWVARGERLDLGQLEWREFVIKPAVSAGAFRTLRTSSGELEAAQRHLDDLVQTQDAMVQPYMQAVEGPGERSLIWIDGEITHAVRKNPALAPDFGVKGWYGTPATADPDERLLVSHVLEGIAADLAYARIDTVRDELGAPRLMELELTEPFLFFRHHPPAAERLARAVARRWVP